MFKFICLTQANSLYELPLYLCINTEQIGFMNWKQILRFILIWQWQQQLFASGVLSREIRNSEFTKLICWNYWDRISQPNFKIPIVNWSGLTVKSMSKLRALNNAMMHYAASFSKQLRPKEPCNSSKSEGDLAKIKQTSRKVGINLHQECTRPRRIVSSKVYTF